VGIRAGRTREKGKQGYGSVRTFRIREHEWVLHHETFITSYQSPSNLVMVAMRISVSN
jgi:hypothetical protein